MKRIAIGLALAVFVCAAIPALAQDEVEFSFQRVVYPGDTFTELLGINKASTVVGYHGATLSRGFVLTPPGNFTDQNVPGATQTQVFGINNSNQTSGFYVDSQGNDHGFIQTGGIFTTVAYPGSQNNQLHGLNNTNQATGFYDYPLGHHDPYGYDELGNVFRLIWIPQSILSPGGGSCLCSAVETGVNDKQQVTGYYVDTHGVTHGWLLSPGLFQTLDFPGATMTQALGINNGGVVVGVYQDTGGNRHGFVYNPASTDEVYDSIDEPKAVGTTAVTGINDNGKVVGYYVDSSGHTNGFVGTPIS